MLCILTIPMQTSINSIKHLTRKYVFSKNSLRAHFRLTHQRDPYNISPQYNETEASLSSSNGIRTHKQVVRKQTLNHLSSIFRGYLGRFSSQATKIKKITEKISCSFTLYFAKWNFLALS